MDQNEKDAVAAAMLLRAYCCSFPVDEDNVYPCKECIFFGITGNDNNRCGLRVDVPCGWGLKSIINENKGGK